MKYSPRLSPLCSAMDMYSRTPRLCLSSEPLLGAARLKVLGGPSPQTAKATDLKALKVSRGPLKPRNFSPGLPRRGSPRRDEMYKDFVKSNVCMTDRGGEARRT